MSPARSSAARGGDAHRVLDRVVERDAADRAAGRRDQLGCRRTIARFVLTIGATANQNGTALFEGVTVLFLAQFFGVDLTLGQQVTVMWHLHPRRHRHRRRAGGLAAGGRDDPRHGRHPAEGIGLILGVDRFLDMCRTTLPAADPPTPPTRPRARPPPPAASAPATGASPPSRRHRAPPPPRRARGAEPGPGPPRPPPPPLGREGRPAPGGGPEPGRVGGEALSREGRRPPSPPSPAGGARAAH